MRSDCSDVAVDLLLRDTQSQSQRYTYTAESLLDADISYHMNTYQTNRLLKKKWRWDTYQRHSGERNSYALPWVRGTLDREQSTLGVRVCCFVYVYSSAVADNHNYNHKLVRAKNLTKNIHMSVLVLHVIVAHRRPGVSHEVQHRVEAAVGVARGEWSVCVTFGQTNCIIIQEKTWCRLWRYFRKNIIRVPV